MKAKSKACKWKCTFSEFRVEDKIVVAMALVLLFAYLTTLSASLDEEDSVHFAMALREFNVTKNQPHPPGFPVYVALGKAFMPVAGNEVLALTSMSAVFGVLSFIVVYVFLRERLGRRRALAASVICASTPLFWLSSVKALSDMMGLFFTMVPLFLLWKYNSCGGRRLAYIGMLVAGIAAGVRIHSALLLLPAAAIAFRQRKETPSEILKSVSFFVIGAALWVAPLVTFSGLPAYAESASGQLLYRVGNTEISLIGMSSPVLPFEKLYAELHYFLMEGYGVNLWVPGILGVALLSALAVLICRVAGSVPGQKDFVFFSVPLAIYCMLVFILLPAINPRYFLILVPFISALLAAGIWKMERKDFRIAALAITCALLLMHSIALASAIHDEKAPLLQMIEYMERVPGREAVISGSFLSDYIKYYPAGIDAIPVDTSCAAVSAMLGKGRVVLSTSRGDCPCIAYAKVAEFSRDMRVHVKRGFAELYLLSLSDC